MFEEYAIIDNLNDTNFYWDYVTAIYGSYKIYCNEAGYKNVLGRNNFVKRMEAIGFEKVKSREGWYLKKTFLEKRL
jgi:phage/plasmid-associated DNA primase